MSRLLLVVVSLMGLCFFFLSCLVSDLENFLSDGLKGETLSKRAKERREAFIKRIKEVKLR